MDPGTIDFWGVCIKKKTPPAPKESRHNENRRRIIHSTPPYLASDNINPPPAFGCVAVVGRSMAC